MRFLHPFFSIILASLALVGLALMGALDREMAVIVLVASLIVGVTLCAISHAWPTRLGVLFIGQSLLVGLAQTLLPPPPPGTGPAILLAFGAFVPAAITASLTRWAVIRHFPPADAPPAPINDLTARIVVIAIAIGCLMGAVGLSQQAILLAETAQPIEAASEPVQVDGPGEALPTASVSQILVSTDTVMDGLIDVEITNTSDYTLTLLEVEVEMIDSSGIARGRAYFRLGVPILPLLPDGRTEAQLALPPNLRDTAGRGDYRLRLRSSFARGER